MKLSYLITCSNETETLRNLLGRIYNSRDPEDEIVIILDSDCKDNKKTKWILETYQDRTWFHHTHSLNNDYSSHKNWGATKCSGDFVFQIDGDELPTETLLLNLKDIIDANPGTEAFWVPRINDFKGVTEQHAMRWGWRLTPSTSIIHEKIIDTNSEEYKFLKNNGYILEETNI